MLLTFEIDLYLKVDVLQLADAFTKIQKYQLKKYGLCSSHQLRAPALSRDTMFNMEKVELELISNAIMTQNKKQDILDSQKQIIYKAMFLAKANFLETGRFKSKHPKIWRFKLIQL